MRRTRISAGLVVLAIMSMLAALTSTASVGAQPADLEPLLLDNENEELAYWQLSREDYGLRADAAYVERLASQKVGQETIPVYSFPLTNRERQLMEKRDAISEEASEIAERFYVHDLYGGLYLGEHLGDGLIVNVVGTGKDAAALKNDIRSLVRHKDQLRFERSTSSLKDLQAEADAILRSISAEKGIAEVYVDEVENLVVVEMPSDQAVVE